MNELKAKSILLGLVLCGGLISAQVYEMTSGDLLYPAGVSDNGSVVMSSSAGNFMWTEAGVLVTLNTISNGFENAGNPSISNDGTKISGTFTHPESNMNGWGLYDVASGNWTPLEGIGGETDGSESSAWGMSGDGSTIVGLGWVDAGTAHAIKWTETDGTVDMGSTVLDRSTRANDVNTDGSVIVGWQDGVTGFRQGAVWIDGNQTLLTDADGNELGEAGAVSGDGNWIVGGGMEAWIWNAEEGLQTISHPNGGQFFRGSSTAVSDDGGVVIGFYRGWPGPPFTGEGFIWTPETGRIDLNEYVTSLGMDDLGINFGLPLAISSDGTMIAGTGTKANNDIVTFLIKLPGNMNVSDLNQSDLTFYPNPVKNVLNLNSKSPIQNVAVYNLAGQKVILNSNLTNNQINVSSLNSGVYVFRVTLQNGKTETFKVVKK